MTYRYQIIVGGKPSGESFSSAAEVQAALTRLLHDGRTSTEASRILVGRLTSETSGAVAGRGVFPATAFLPNAPNPDPDEQYWHRRVRDLLNTRLQERRSFFLWLNVERGTGSTELSDSEFLRAVETWLAQLRTLREASGTSGSLTHLDSLERHSNPTERGGKWSWQGTELEWIDPGLHVMLTAIPRRKDAQGETVEIVGNPEPAFAFYD